MKKSCPICKSLSIQNSFAVGEYQYNHCLSCRTLFLSPLPTRKFVRSFYKRDFTYSAGLVSEKLIRKRAKVILKTLIKFNPKGVSLLDIGSGYGYFLDEAKKIGLSVSGVEPSKGLFTHIKNQYKIPIYNCDFKTFYHAKKQKNKFDFITLIHVIEHEPIPSELISLCFDLLDKKGILFIETPNIKSYLFNVLKERYDFLIPPDHIYLFSQTSFFKMIDQRIAAIKKFNTYSYPEHFMGIIKKLLFKKNTQTHTVVSKQTKSTSKISKTKQIKLLIFDKGLAQILHPLMNILGYGSILEIYVQKK